MLLPQITPFTAKDIQTCYGSTADAAQAYFFSFMSELVLYMAIGRTVPLQAHPPYPRQATPAFEIRL
ncbi:hypothetical protein ACR780_21905 [Sphingobacterium faecium]|uniref:hypothetical protein n=1 Tax=Sphingobacterium faecium TaxID=34087 RepID=UPI003DA1DF91